MPRGFVDDPEGDVADEKVNDGGFGDDILFADADGVDVLLLNVGQHHAAAVTDDLCRGIDVKGVGCVPESLFHVRSERLLAFILTGITVTLHLIDIRNGGLTGSYKAHFDFMKKCSYSHGIPP